MQPLDPVPLLQPHYRPSSLERTGPPQNLSSVLSPYGFRHLCFSLGIQALVPVVPHKSLDRVHAPFTPAAARPVTKYPAHSSQRIRSPLVPAAFIPIDASSKGLLSLVSPDRTCLEIYLQTFTPTLTTAAFDRSSLEWFEARSWKLASKGLPSSLTQLVHAQVSFPFRKTSLFVRYGTHRIEYYIPSATRKLMRFCLHQGEFRRARATFKPAFNTSLIL